MSMSMSMSTPTQTHCADVSVSKSSNYSRLMYVCMYGSVCMQLEGSEWVRESQWRRRRRGRRRGGEEEEERKEKKRMGGREGGDGGRRTWVLLASAVAVGAGGLASLFLPRTFFFSSRSRTRAVGIIPARYLSSRFEGKPLALILGKPMIQVSVFYTTIFQLFQICLYAPFCKMFQYSVRRPV